MPVYSPIYSLPYVLFLLYLFALFVIERNRINRGYSAAKIQNITWLSLLFFIGFRGFIYTDWFTYYPVYEYLPTIGNTSIQNLDTDWELGFVLYTILLKTLGVSYWGWNFISSFIDLFLLHLLLKKRTKNYYVLAFIAYYIYSGLLMEVNLMRNMKSIILFLVSISYLEKRKFIPYLILNVIGIFFHISSIVYLLLYFVLSKRISRKVYWVIFGIGNLIFLMKIKFVTPILLFVAGMIGGRSEMLLMYMENNMTYGITIGYIERVFFFLLLLYFYDKVQKDGNRYVYLNIYTMYFISYFYLAEFPIISERLSYLFIISYWFLIPVFYSYFSIQKRKIFFWALVLYGTMKTIAANDSLLCRYDNLLFGIEQYEDRRYLFNRYSDKLIVQ